MCTILTQITANDTRIQLFQDTNNNEGRQTHCQRKQPSNHRGQSPQGYDPNRPLQLYMDNSDGSLFVVGVVPPPPTTSMQTATYKENTLHQINPTKITSNVRSTHTQPPSHLNTSDPKRLRGSSHATFCFKKKTNCSNTPHVCCLA